MELRELLEITANCPDDATIVLSWRGISDTKTALDIGFIDSCTENVRIDVWGGRILFTPETEWEKATTSIGSLRNAELETYLTIEAKMNCGYSYMNEDVHTVLMGDGIIVFVARKGGYKK